MTIVRLFSVERGVHSELFQGKPSARAVELLEELQGRLTLEVHKEEVEQND
jgi:hypothetical protein